MSAPQTGGQVDPFVRALIRYKARRLLRLPQFHADDRADLEQALALQLWQRRGQFDRQRAPWPAFVRLIIDHAVANLLRDSVAEKRSPGPTPSLQTPTTCAGAPTDLGAQMEDRERDRRFGRRPLSDLELAQLRHDLAEVLAALPTETRRVAEALKHYRTKAEAARCLGMSRAELYAQVRQLRERFELARLQDYL
jgi:RNA polymerase sigma factor (sigma-70 family)